MEMVSGISPQPLPDVLEEEEALEVEAVAVEE